MHIQGSPYCILRLSRFQTRWCAKLPSLAFPPILGTVKASASPIIKNSIISICLNLAGSFLMKVRSLSQPMGITGHD